MEILKETNTINLFQETCDAFDINGVKWEDVIWIGGNDFEIPLRDFIRLAKETNYDNDYGKQRIASDLTIITTSGRFVRGEYDGLEWWNFIKNKLPYRKYYDVTSLVSNTGWETLSEIYEETHNG
jgi:hypothetical protein